MNVHPCEDCGVMTTAPRYCHRCASDSEIEKSLGFYTHIEEQIAAGNRAEGAKEERAAIVTWLRKNPELIYLTSAMAQLIERGEHLK